MTATKKKTRRKTATAKTATKTKTKTKAVKKDKPRSGLVLPSDASDRVGKNLRRILRKNGIRLSDRPDIGKVEVSAKKTKDGNVWSVKVDGTVYTWTETA